MAATFDEIAARIIKEQALVIGPMAWAEARKVTDLSVDVATEAVHVGGDGKSAIDQLVSRYERLFGRAAQEVCRDAVKSLISSMAPMEVPSSLR